MLGVVQFPMGLCRKDVSESRANVDLARRESPTTDRFYHIDQITDAQSYEFEDFRESLLSRVGISG